MESFDLDDKVKFGCLDRVYVNITHLKMFTSLVSSVEENGIMIEAAESSKLLDGSSEFVLTYEDKDGDWMLVGDVPWRYVSPLSTKHRNGA